MQKTLSSDYCIKQTTAILKCEQSLKNMEKIINKYETLHHLHLCHLSGVINDVLKSIGMTDRQEDSLAESSVY